MATLERKVFDNPDERRPFVDKGQVDVVNVGDHVVGRLTIEPGWRWSTHVGPLMGQTQCEATHVGVVLSGQQGVRMADGTELSIGPGDVFCIPPGHDGWTIGDQPCVLIDFVGMTNYAQQA